MQDGTQPITVSTPSWSNKKSDESMVMALGCLLVNWEFKFQNWQTVGTLNELLNPQSVIWFVHSSLILCNRFIVTRVLMIQRQSWQHWLQGGRIHPGTIIHIWDYLVFPVFLVACLKQWEEIGEPTGNPHRHCTDSKLLKIAPSCKVAIAFYPLCYCASVTTINTQYG